MCVKGIKAAQTQCTGFKSELFWAWGSFEGGMGLGLDFMLLLLSVIQKYIAGKKRS